MENDYLSIKVSEKQAAEIAQKHYHLAGELSPLAGELDFNFKLKNETDSFILKISRPGVDEEFIEFQNKLLLHLLDSEILSPLVFPCVSGKFHASIEDQNGDKRWVRLLSWQDGRLWSAVNPHNDSLRFSLGHQAGSLTKALHDFDHPLAHRHFDWDIANADWTNDHLNLFTEKHQHIVSYFQQKFSDCQNQYQRLRKSLVHNDVNDNNIIVTEDLKKPQVACIIDFGDAVFTQTINDLAVVVAYAVMNKPNVLQAALPVIKGYHLAYPLAEEELELLYTMVAMRLIISVTKSAINKQKEPENTYLLISEKPAWDVLEKWKEVDAEFAHFSFRKACNLTTHPETEKFRNWAQKQSFSIKHLFPTIDKATCHNLDMGMESGFLGHQSDFNDLDGFEYDISKVQKDFPDKILAGGYLETRPIYTTNEYRREGNNGFEYRAIHLGIDYWVPAGTPVHALFDGKVFLATNDAGFKEYGGLVILQHTEEDITFYTLYGHQSVSSVERLKKGDPIKKGEYISSLGTHEENGDWGAHLHFQLMLDLLGNTDEFPGVAYPEEKEVWADICPDPNLLFKDNALDEAKANSLNELIDYRRKHLGKSLSLSYAEPLYMVRGDGAHLLDITGRKYLDTVNNVAHVGHEHPRVVKAGQEQMALLNTNTRYLHQLINSFSEELLATFPQELSVIHFVNSGSEANELALRMAKAYTGERDMIAVEVGYHGNTGACVDVSSYKFDGKGGSGVPKYTHIIPLPDAFRGIYRGENTGPKYAAHVEEQIAHIADQGRGLAAFICESIISCGGQIELPEHYLKLAYESVRKAGGVCISDEVQVGCGRVGTHFWGFQLHDVIPDIVTIGKPIGNGHPLAAVVCTREVANAFANGMEYFNTFGGNPVSCAIGLEVLKVIKDEKLQLNATKVGTYLKDKLTEMQNSISIIGEVRGQGLFLGFELTDENKNPLTEKAAYLANRMKELGILMSTDGKDVNVLKIKPPIVFSKENADELIDRLQIVFKEDFMSL